MQWELYFREMQKRCTLLRYCTPLAVGELARGDVANSSFVLRFRRGLALPPRLEPAERDAIRAKWE
jgi:hypothetical protein